MDNEQSQSRVEYMQRKRDLSKRKTFFGRRRVQIMLTLGVLLLATAMIIGSAASFTSTTANPSNTFTAGNLKHVNSKDGAAIFTIGNDKMKPGDTSTGTVTITNDGDIDGVFTLSASNLVSPAGPKGGVFANTLELTVVEDKGGTTTTIYNGVKMNAIPTANLGTFTAGEARDYTFTVRFPDTGKPADANSGDNIYKQATMSVQFDWESTEL